MHIAATNADCTDLQQHFVIADFRDCHFAHFDRTGFQVVLHDGCHGTAHCLILLTISLKIPFRSLLPVALNECASMAKGAPMTTSGAPYFGMLIACSIER